MDGDRWFWSGSAAMICYIGLVGAFAGACVAAEVPRDRPQLEDASRASLLAAPSTRSISRRSKLTLGLDQLIGRARLNSLPVGSVPFNALAIELPKRRVEAHQALVPLDAIAAEQVEDLEAELLAVGATITSRRGRTVSALVPENHLAELERFTSLAFARPALASTKTGRVTSQGDSAQGSDLARVRGLVSGAGSIIGVLSDSFDCSGVGSLREEIGSGDLPSDVVILDDSACPSSDEGRAMAQILFDIAPGAEIVFHTAFNGQADFAQGIVDLAQYGARIIVDDVIYFAEPFFQDGIIAQAVDDVSALGVSYFSSAGNAGRQAYASGFVGSSTPGPGGGDLHDFDQTDSRDLRLSVEQRRDTVYVLQWQDPFFSVSGPPGAVTDLDICFYQPPGASAPFWCASDNNLGRDPVEVVRILGGGALEISIERREGPPPGAMKLVMFGDSSFLEPYAGTDSGTIAGHANSATANAVGASAYFLTPAYGEDPPLLNDYSSAGTTAILFDRAGLPINEVRQKPDFTAPDGGNNTFFGVDIDRDGFPNFFGTSASAPHAAGLAALMRECNPELTPGQLTATLKQTSVDILARQDGTSIGAGYDDDSGAGLVDANAAVWSACSGKELGARVGIYRPSSGRFILDTEGEFGSPDWESGAIGGDSFLPVSGDWMGDGNTQLGLYDVRSGHFFLDANGNRRWDGPAGDLSAVFVSGTGFLPVVGDWNADGRTELGVYQEGSGTWFVDMDGDGRWQQEHDLSFAFGCATCLPMSGDWNGGGRTLPGYYDPTVGALVLAVAPVGSGPVPQGVEEIRVGGGQSFIPVSGDWNGDGLTDLGLFNARTGMFFIDADGNRLWSPTSDRRFRYGLQGDKPVAGVWPLF